MQVVGNTNIKQPKLNFGSRENPPINLNALNQPPADYGDKYIPSELEPYPPQTSSQVHYYTAPNGRKPSIAKPLITLALTATAITLAIKKRKNIAGLFKKTKSNNIKSLDKFNDLHTDVIDKVNNQKISEFKLPKLTKIILEGKNADEKKAALEKAYYVSRMSALNEVQPKMTVLMPEELANAADDIINKIKIGKIDEIDTAHLEKIDGFKITKTGSTHSEIAVQKQVGHSINTDSFSDRFNAIARRVFEFLRRP